MATHAVGREPSVIRHRRPRGGAAVTTFARERRGDMFDRVFTFFGKGAAAVVADRARGWG